MEGSVYTKESLSTSVTVCMYVCVCADALTVA